MRKIRVVVVDDSAFNRRAIIRMLEVLPEIEVVGYATNGEEGIRKIVDLKPDLVTLDLEMPKMDGFTMLRIIMATCPTPVLVISARSEDERVFKALELGAVDFIAKPVKSISPELLTITEDLHNKIRSVFDLNMAGIRDRVKRVERVVHVDKPSLPASHISCGAGGASVVAIGTSTGGPPALQQIFSSFTEPLQFCVLIAQHMPPGFTKSFADRLNRLSGFEIREGQDGDVVRPGTVLIAPGGKNMTVEARGGENVIRLSAPSPSDKFIPSVDVLFDSCAAVFGPALLGVVLTGMGNDGSRGVRQIKAAGGQVIAEAEISSIVFGMPREAIATGVVDRVVPLDRMAREMVLRATARHEA